MTYDMSKEGVDRIADLKLRCLDCDVPTFEPVDLNANYTILTTAFMAGGGDGYDVFLNERLGFENLGERLGFTAILARQQF